jgi:DNA invertase Pin-like site-specific DNA recombinase
MPEPRIALYARVSSEQQARGNTVASQLAALRERVASAGLSADPGDVRRDDQGRSSYCLTEKCSWPGVVVASRSCSRRT